MITFSLDDGRTVQFLPRDRIVIIRFETSGWELHREKAINVHAGDWLAIGDTLVKILGM